MSSVLLTHIVSLRVRWSKLACCELPYEETIVTRAKGRLKPTGVELGPSTQHPTRNWIFQQPCEWARMQILPHGALTWLQFQLTPWLQACERQQAMLTMLRFLIHSNCKKINYCYFKPVSLGGIFYVALQNKYIKLLNSSELQYPPLIKWNLNTSLSEL